MKSKEVILIVGENVNYVLALKESILEFGYDCYTANSSNEGIQVAFDFTPDLIIYHTVGQYFKSFDFFNILRESSITYDIPFVLLAEDISKEELQFALEIGVDGVFDKPLRLSDMQRIVDGRIKKYVRIKRESEREFLRSFDISLHPAVVYNSEFKVIAANDIFDSVFTINRDQPLYEALGIDKEAFMRMSYKIFANLEGQEVFMHHIEINGVKRDYQVSVNSLNAIFAKRSAFLVFHPINGSRHIGEEPHKVGALFSDDILRHRGIKRSGAAAHNRINFTKRQLEVLELSILGLPMKLIADRLCISEKTVEKYRAGLMEKTGAKNIIELVIFAIKNGYVEV